jgi:hypothetical protein
MSKRRKKNRRDKLPKPAVVKRKLPGGAVVFLGVVVVVFLGFWWWQFKAADIPRAPDRLMGTKAAVFDKLKGGWRRPDGGYVLAIKDVAESGAMEAAYFNPNPIHVAKAEALHNVSGTKVFVELRDVNYPGSTYTLTYDPARDRLKGIYYQAVERQRFEVVFERIK